MTARTKQLGKQAMDALENALLSALADAENGECSNVGTCNGKDEHGPSCMTRITGIYSSEDYLYHVIVAGTLQYLESKYLVEKLRGYRLTTAGKELIGGEN